MTSLVEEALDALRRRTGIVSTFSVSRMGRPGDETDGVVELRRGTHRARFDVVVKATFRQSHIARLREGVVERGARALLVTRHVSSALAEKMQRVGMPFVDSAGNAFIDTDDWFVLATGASAPKKEPVRHSLSPATWKVAYTLLRQPGAMGFTIRELAEHAGTSHGAAHTALRAMAERGWVEDLGRRGRVVVNPEALWRAWEVGYGDRLSRKLFVTMAVTPGGDSMQSWLQGVRTRLQGNSLLGGEAGAQLMGADILATTAVVHVRRWTPSVMRQLGLLPSREERSPVVIRETFGHVNHDPADPQLADRMLIRAELMAINDERLDSTRLFLTKAIQGRMKDGP